MIKGLLNFACLANLDTLFQNLSVFRSACVNRRSQLSIKLREVFAKQDNNENNLSEKPIKDLRNKMLHYSA